jgi:hypothetical protein
MYNILIITSMHYVQIMSFHFYIRVEQLHGKLEVTGYIH